VERQPPLRVAHDGRLLESTPLLAAGSEGEAERDKEKKEEKKKPQKKRVDTDKERNEKASVQKQRCGE
jgi:hypothetical protein